MCGNAWLPRSIYKLEQLAKIYAKSFLCSSICLKLNVANKVTLHDELGLNKYSCLVGTSCLYHIICGNQLILDGQNIPHKSELVW